MSRPLFSIVVPTRNRPDYVVDTVESLLLQTFIDLEVIISDNSSEAGARATYARLSHFVDGVRCRYVRPDRDLNMVSHWEWALKHASGEYVAVVTDRMALRLYTLEEVARVIASDAPDSICLASVNTREFMHVKSLPKISGKIKYRYIQTSDKIFEFSHGVMPKDCPRMLNSFTRMDIVTSIRNKFGVVFDSIAPDYFFCFRLMDEIDQFCSIDLPLLVTQGEHLSNGRAFKIGKMNEASTQFLDHILEGQKQWLRYGPIPDDIWILPNVILREYEAVRATSQTGRMPPVDETSFYRHTVAHLFSLARSGELDSRSVEAITAFQRRTGAQPADDIRRLAAAQSAPLARLRALREACRRVRHALDPFADRLGLGRRIVGRSLADVLKRDAANYAKGSARHP